MKKIGIISDTHGLFDDKLRYFLRDVDEIWHAGDIGTVKLADEIVAFKPLRAVWGNIDGADLRRVYSDVAVFECEGARVVMTHIGGYPKRYVP
ncbi:MAG: metallophosphoesterase family protein, partial [Rikenellaceae bacterium]